MSFLELTKDQFIERLVEAGWTRDEALAEWKSTMEDEVDESGNVSIRQTAKFKDYKSNMS